jgi:hypothetical protein
MFSVMAQPVLKASPMKSLGANVSRAMSDAKEIAPVSLRVVMGMLAGAGPQVVGTAGPLAKSHGKRSETTTIASRSVKR